MDRDEMRETGAALRRRLDPGAPHTPIPGLRDFLDEAVFGGLWARPGLPQADRMVCTLTALAILDRREALGRAVAGALDLGLPPRAIVEVFVQVGLYGGFPLAEAAAGVAAAVFAEHGIELDAEPPRRESFRELESRGRSILAELHGERGHAGYAAPDHPTTGPLYAVAISYGYGEIWDRPGLDRRQRMLVAIAGFAALRLEGQLLKFAQSAPNAGVSHAEVLEAVMQTAPSAGFPGTLSLLQRLADVLDP